MTLEQLINTIQLWKEQVQKPFRVTVTMTKGVNLNGYPVMIGDLFGVCSDAYGETDTVVIADVGDIYYVHGPIVDDDKIATPTHDPDMPEGFF